MRMIRRIVRSVEITVVVMFQRFQIVGISRSMRQIHRGNCGVLIGRSERRSKKSNHHREHEDKADHR